MIHLGIAHRALDYKDWFIKTVTLVNNTFFVYVDPVSWVNRHRLHHKFSDHAGDPNKLDSDGFWRTLYRCLFPYPCTDDLANDAILKTWPFRLVSHPLFVVDLAGSELRSFVVVRSRLAVRHRRLAQRPGLRAVGEHGAELLDARPPLGLAAL